MQYTQNLECNKWQFNDVPLPTKGNLSPYFANCGCGMEIDVNGPTKTDSFMHTLTNISSEDAREYAEILKKNGYKEALYTIIDSDFFYRFEKDNVNVSLAYRNAYNTLKVIRDVCNTVSFNDFGYTDYKKVNDDTMFIQYSLHYSHMIKGYSTDCGMNYLYRLQDNSLVIIDGGEFEQCTEIAFNDYLKLLREITGTKEGEKIRISLWLCTHAHNDHMDFFSKLMLRCSDDLLVERAAFNFPHYKNEKHSDSVELMKKRLVSKYPNIKYVKARTGDVFNIGELKFTVLNSNEDSFAVDENGEVDINMNATSTVFTVESQGIKTLFLADMGHDMGHVVCDSYTDETLKCDFLQCAHHGINHIDFVYKRIKAGKVLLPQCRLNMMTRFQEVFDTLKEEYGENNIVFAYDKTMKYTIKEGNVSAIARAHVGSVYDGAEW